MGKILGILIYENDTHTLRICCERAKSGGELKNIETKKRQTTGLPVI